MKTLFVKLGFACTLNMRANMAHFVNGVISYHVIINVPMNTQNSCLDL